MPIKKKAQNWGSKLPKKPQIQSCITQFFKNNKKKTICAMTEKIELLILLKSFAYPNSHIFVRPKRVWLFGYLWLSGVWLFGDTTVLHFTVRLPLPNKLGNFLHFWCFLASWNLSYWKEWLKCEYFCGFFLNFYKKFILISSKRCSRNGLINSSANY